MRRALTVPLFSVALLAALAFAPAPTPAAGAGPAAIEEMLRSFFKAIETGNRDAALACLADKDSPFPIVTYAIDREGKPVTIEGLEAMTKYVDTFVDAAKKEGGKYESKIAKIHADCHSPELGYATIEYARTMTSQGKSTTRELRATALVYSDKNSQWHIFHWHGSAAKAEMAGKKAENATVDTERKK